MAVPNQQQAQTVEVKDRFRGPPNSGNGGYVGGLVASLYDDNHQPIEVTLRAPIPMDQPLEVLHTSQGISLHRGDQLIVESQPATIDMQVPTPPTLDEVDNAAPDSVALINGLNPFLPKGKGFHPICFCCGAQHDDGLQVFAAPVQGGAQVAVRWHAKEQWGVEGNLPMPYVWAALDCPGQFAYYANDITTGMLGRITGQADSVAAGQDYLITGWRIAVEGKKHFAGTALFTLQGELLAKTTQVWIGRRA